MDDLKIVGLGIGTSNSGNQSARDIGELWRIFNEGRLIDKIPHKVNSDIYLVYTDYDSDYTGAYTCMLGCQVKFFDNIPSDMVGRTFVAQNQKHYVASGKMPDAVIHIWEDIWRNDALLNRLYEFDYELYSEKSFRIDNPEVDIYIGVR